MKKLYYEHFDYAWEVCDFVNNTLNGEYEDITEGIGGYTVWYKKED